MVVCTRPSSSSAVGHAVLFEVSRFLTGSSSRSQIKEGSCSGSESSSWGAMEVGAEEYNRRLCVEPISWRRNLRPVSFDIQPGLPSVVAGIYDDETAVILPGVYGSSTAVRRSR